MSPLEFDTTYHYQVGLGFVVNGEATFMVKSEQVYNFTTRSEDPDEISVLMFADMGVVFSPMNVKRIQNRVRQQAMNGNFFIYHIGDISYADFYPGMMYQFIWNLWFEYFDEIHPYVPYMVSVGNHEYEPRHPDNQDYEQNFAAYNHKFWMPLRNNSQYGHNMWYHFDFGPVRFVSIDTETNYPHPHESPYPPIFNGNQFSYVTNAIKSTNRSQTPFLVVLGHRPIYSAVKGFSDANGNVLSRSKVLQNVWERVFYEGHVDLYTCGHVHAYERQYPVYNQTVETKSNPNNLTNPRDTVHLIVGTGGCIEGLELNEWYNKNIYWNYKIFNDDEGYALLRVKRDKTNRRQMTITWEFYSTTHDELVDSFVMTKTY
ncbi:hypothetical protein C9374_001156 [Naegleria lovaniensis]|uniref:Purple acid phosphatase n=1 Tax=Naegleria lovaniensis TaxID=51637 RepID=A0AA88GRK2_NAELO|nr:uncharacterized protein C9374_001156 [Naegleria lovaniensis]KAG2387562.1 hypothetical protein C9374_001156 [Naegleria lovaniensis]